MKPWYVIPVLILLYSCSDKSYMITSNDEFKGKIFIKAKEITLKGDIKINDGANLTIQCKRLNVNGVVVFSSTETAKGCVSIQYEHLKKDTLASNITTKLGKDVSFSFKKTTFNF